MAYTVGAIGRRTGIFTPVIVSPGLKCLSMVATLVCSSGTGVVIPEIGGMSCVHKASGQAVASAPLIDMASSEKMHSTSGRVGVARIWAGAGRTWLVGHIRLTIGTQVVIGEGTGAEIILLFGGQVV
jgi:hypothetical protein